MKTPVNVTCSIFLVLTFFTACANQTSTTNTTRSAATGAGKYLVVDTHIDLPHRLFEEYEDVSVSTESGDFDWPRAQRGGLNVAFMSVYIPADLQEKGGARAHAETLIEMMESLAVDHSDKFSIVTDTKEARAAAATGKIGFALGMENGAGIEDDLSALAYFYERGIRYITLTHSKANLICDSSYDENRPWGGLSPFGEAVVREMNRLGIMIDVSHLSDEAFYDVMAIVATPVIASHSSARTFTPGWERNMSDDMIRALARNAGVIQINFGSTFLTAEANAWSAAYSDSRDALMEKTGWDRQSDEVKAWQEQYKLANPYPFATLDDVLDH
ncbi:MAG: membrane dipeptidase, partial [Gammaproteobacteria bacterium]|nr:membrane dipeptidase [Gammaproteobacteria bacterium]